MTVFGTDVSSHQEVNGKRLDLAAAKQQGYDFVSIKLTEGSPAGNNAYVNPTAGPFLADAKANGFLVMLYHALHKGNAQAQADWFCSHYPDKSIPAHVDFEPFGDNPTRADCVAFERRCATHGVTVRSDYFPEWYYDELPALKRSTRGLGALCSSKYPDQRHDYASAVYKSIGGDNGPGWKKYGPLEVTPTIWQFTDNAKIDGWAFGVDADAFRGTVDDLAATGVFKDYRIETKPKHTKPPANVIAARKKLRLAEKFHGAKTAVGKAIRSALNSLRGI